MNEWLGRTNFSCPGMLGANGRSVLDSINANVRCMGQRSMNWNVLGRVNGVMNQQATLVCKVSKKSAFGMRMEM